MSGFWQRTLIYLGLREEPDDRVEWDVLAAAGSEGVAPVPAATAASSPAQRPVRRPPDAPAAATNVRTLHETTPVTAPAAPRSAGAAARVAVVQLRAFDDVEAVGANHRDRRPVLLDIGACDHPTARRVIDFVSGLTYATGGSLRRVTARGYLLLPDGVALDADERARLAQAGYPIEVRPSTGPR
jgi:cell division inhibitor SepF